MTNPRGWGRGQLASPYRAHRAGKRRTRRKSPAQVSPRVGKLRRMKGNLRIPLVWFFLLAPCCGPFPASAQGADPPFYPDKTKLLVWRDADGTEHPITKAADWEKSFVLSG